MRPRRIILVRHGEAEGNVDETLFETKPDHQMELTPRGWAHAREAGEQLRALTGGEPTQIYVSPYVRTRQTLAAVREALDPTAMLRALEEPRLREQDWGNLQVRANMVAQKNARNAFGHFYYRFTHGESGADVYDRVSTFLETMHRDFQRDDFPPNALIVTHGLTMRLFLMRWFHWSVEYFESLENPDFCEIRTLVREEHGRYLLEGGPLRQWKPVPLGG
jgi:broad specificity phosphatase PhoE